MIRFLTAGESHGKALTVIVDGVPSNISITEDDINRELEKRKFSVGRSGRAKIESDTAEILSGVRFGKTIGSPVSIIIKNLDWENWKDKVAPKITTPRPNHADFSGAVKYGLDDIRNVLERSSARETAARVAAGAVAKTILKNLDIHIRSHVIQIGNASTKINIRNKEEFDALESKSNKLTRCLDGNVSRFMEREVDKAEKNGDSLGGIFEVFAFGLAPGIGGYSQWDERLDGEISRAISSIPAIKGVEIGDGFKLADKYGSEVADEIYHDKNKGYYRKTNHMGGIEGGMSSGETVIVRAVMKPIPTIRKELDTVDIKTKNPAKSFYERSDVCAVPRAAIIAEAMCAITIANFILYKFGGDNFLTIKESYKRYTHQVWT